MNQVLKRPMVANELNRLLHALSRALVLYVDEIKPWSLASHGPVWTAIGRLAADTRNYAERTAQAIVDHGGQPSPGAYPLQYARLNDLSLEFFLREIIASLKSDQEVVRQCIDAVAGVPSARSLAEEIYGNLQGHAELLEKAASEL